MSAVNAAGIIGHPYPVNDTLFFKIQGDSDTIQQTARVIETIVQRHGSSQFTFAPTDEAAEDLWQSRKYALTASLSAYPGTRGWTTDVWCASVTERVV